jgi:hypothetical protein
MGGTSSINNSRTGWQATGHISCINIIPPPHKSDGAKQAQQFEAPADLTRERLITANVEASIHAFSVGAQPPCPISCSLDLTGICCIK